MKGKTRISSRACANFTALLLALLLPTIVSSQENRVLDPEINERFKDPDVEANVESLEREDRPVYKYRHAIVAAMGLEAGEDVADVGAGSGFLSRLMAREVAPEGQVYAVDIAQE
ncbi:MAG TPA: hypothetical protein VJB15_02475, partial [Rhodothermia bacterium]|nr:hypothetical protein [Rhodothermia bacterium]